MKAIILAAGKGRRMRELTMETPKPMLNVRGSPILEHIVRGLVTSGITEICIVTGWQADVIEKYFADGSAFGARICYERQPVLEGTAQAMNLAQGFVGEEPFFLTFGDILVNPATYKTMVTIFEFDSADGLVAVTQGEDVTKGGLLFFDQDFRLTNLIEKPSLDDLAALTAAGRLKPNTPLWYNAGIHIFRPVVFEYSGSVKKSARGEYELMDAMSAMLAGGHVIKGCQIEGGWVDVRDPEVLADVQHRP